jgi:hypothetical protein
MPLTEQAGKCCSIPSSDRQEDGVNRIITTPWLICQGFLFVNLENVSKGLYTMPPVKPYQGWQFRYYNNVVVNLPGLSSVKKMFNLQGIEKPRLQVRLELNKSLSW